MFVCSVSVGERWVSTPSVASIGSSSSVEFIRVMPSSARTLVTAPISESVLRVVSDSRSFASFQSGLMLLKDLLVLDLPGHDGARDAGGLEGVDEFGQFAQREPVYG